MTTAGPYIRGRKTEYEAIQYANKLIKTDDAERDLETLKCYHDIKAGKHRAELAQCSPKKFSDIKLWLHNVEMAFGIGGYNDTESNI
jgi:hypothetical protein